MGARAEAGNGQLRRWLDGFRREPSANDVWFVRRLVQYIGIFALPSLPCSLGRSRLARHPRRPIHARRGIGVARGIVGALTGAPINAPRILMKMSLAGPL